MILSNRVSVSRRFQRAVRIDTDLNDPLGLDGFVCTQSSAAVLETMARHVAEARQGAFTWTGPYGSGKSTLAVALSALLCGKSCMRQNAAAVIGNDTAEAVWAGMPPKSCGWCILPIVGSRDNPEQLVWEAIEAKKLLRKTKRGSWSGNQALDALRKIAFRKPESTGGLLIIFDEMGKILEGAVRGKSDVYFFQQLAEMASRSNGRLVIIGILHQAFEEYSYRLSRELREEWAKIQGRFIDLSVNTAADEQIGLLGRAIQSDHRPKGPSSLSKTVAGLSNRTASSDLPILLEFCWPLHPVVACLLGPISRRRFGQNQRSIFGFLNSSEPRGFQDFLRHADDSELYPPNYLWDYLRLNLEPSILASPDGHRWALAVDALERCQSLGGQERHLRFLETIALVDLFRDRSGLVPSMELLECVFLENDSEALKKALDQLQEWSIVVYRKFSNSFSIFEGSDFDVDSAVGRALQSSDGVDFAKLNAITDLQPIVAKRYYHEKGTMRWYDVAIAPLADILANSEGYRPRPGGVGTFLLAVPTLNEDLEKARLAVRHVVCEERPWDLAVGLPQEAWNFASLARELLATEKVREESPELRGDRVARSEIEARISNLRGYIETEIARGFNNAFWQVKDLEDQHLTQAQLNGLASDLADRRFNKVPQIHNELLNRVKPSSNAVAARNVLLRQMALHEGEERLGIKGFPAEGGLFASLLEKSKLYQKTHNSWRFVSPRPGDNDPCNLNPAWRAATALLESNRQRLVPVSKIYEIWQRPPFGIKEGLLPVLIAAYLLSQRRVVAFYKQSIFQARVTDIDMDYLSKDPDYVQLRWINLSGGARELLLDMAAIVRTLDQENSLSIVEPIDVAKGLVSIYDQLPPWVDRTQHLSANAKRVRQLLKRAIDPNSLIFDDIPRSFSAGLDLEPNQGNNLRRIPQNVHLGLVELQQAFPALLQRLREGLLTELQVINSSLEKLSELRARAENIRDLSGDHRMEAFVMRIAQFTNSDADIESLASMVANKPTRNWVDTDIDRTTVEIAEMARRFIRIESFAHVKGRTDKRHSMAVSVGLDGPPTTVHKEFDVTSLERPEVDALINRIKDTLRSAGEERGHIVLAALAELSASYLHSYEANDSATEKAAELLVTSNGT